MKLRIYILTIIGLLFSGLLKAQFPSTTQQGGSAFPTNGFPTGNQQDKDTKKATNSNGRIGLDDSTKVVYGPTSTRYFLEEDVFNNRKRLYNIDTIIDGIHNYNFVQRNKNLYQDLGNLGTAIRPVFYKAPEQIGTLLGYDAYTLYAFKPNQVRYYNTKSPFTNIIYVPGGGEQDLLQFELSRNIDSLWNVGLNVQRITANKTLVDQTSTGDNSSIGHWDFMLHSNYQTKNKKYSLLAYFNLSDHNSNDQGGVVLESGRDYQGMLALADNRPILTVASTRDNSYNLHVYHEYVGYKAFQIFQTLDYQTRRVRFGDKGFSEAWQTGFYPYAFKKNLETPYRYAADTSITNNVVLDSIYNESKYRNFEAKTGIKGFYKGFNYRMHLRTRIFSYTNPLKSAYDVSNKNENFLGLWLNQYFKDSTRVFGEVEFSTDLNNLRINGEFQGKWLNVGGSFISTPPTLVQQRTYNNGFRWSNVLDNVKTTNIYAYTNLRFKQLVLRPSADITKVSSYTYFDTLAYVQQSKSDIEIYRVGLGLDFRKGKFSTTNQIYYTTTTGPDLIRIPNLFINSRVAFDLLYRKKLFIQTGLEFHYKSSYYADAYMPAIQQFNLQDKQNIEGYLQADAFADMRINRVRIFLKFAHANNGLLNNGYYASPGFAGMGRVLAFGVHWLLFD